MPNSSMNTPMTISKYGLLYAPTHQRFVAEAARARRAERMNERVKQ